MNSPTIAGASRSRRALFLDRDGVINVDHGYVYRPDDFELMDGIVELVRAARRLDFLPVVVTNQSGIARGYFTEADFEALSAYMLDRFDAEGAPIERIYHCPFHKDATVDRYRQDHPDRKPLPGMFLRAAADLDLDLPNSAMIGDKPSDVEAARAAGLRHIALLSPEAGAATALGATPLASLKEAAEWLISLDKVARENGSRL